MNEKTICRDLQDSTELPCATSAPELDEVSNAVALAIATSGGVDLPARDNKIHNISLNGDEVEFIISALAVVSPHWVGFKLPLLLCRRISRETGTVENDEITEQFEKNVLDEVFGSNYEYPE
jgi:hypothetical protein